MKEGHYYLPYINKKDYKGIQWTIICEQIPRMTQATGTDSRKNRQLNRPTQVTGLDQ